MHLQPGLGESRGGTQGVRDGEDVPDRGVTAVEPGSGLQVGEAAPRKEVRQSDDGDDEVEEVVDPGRSTDDRRRDDDAGKDQDPQLAQHRTPRMPA